jgi:hypothetical protein
VFHILLTKPEGKGLFGGQIVNDIEHDGTEIRCEVMFGTEVDKISRVHRLAFMSKVMRGLGSCLGQKFVLCI